MYKIYTQNNCGYCIAAKNLLDKKGEQYEEIHLEDNPDAKNKLKQDGLRTVSQSRSTVSPSTTLTNLHLYSNIIPSL